MYDKEWEFGSVPYEKNLKIILESDCILEIMHPGFQGITQRYMEAVCYNKKLLTNNREIKKDFFYDPDYMSIFDDPEEIDTDWIKKKVKVNFNYQDEFGPLHCLEIMKGYIDEMDVSKDR
ncbi:hypothetical protein [Eisenbergiella tayi]|uniref:hypothetical protein n=1 Tax=Eisenbergiella tayi TaxID=1432052 RepID=UPI001495B84D|nr:hypothetical protein [Eisenbergiella tayi]